MKFSFPILSLLIITSTFTTSGLAVVEEKKEQEKVEIIPITIEKNGEHVFAFEENPSTGYSWQFKIENKGFITIKRGDWITSAVQQEIVGAPGTRSFTVKAVNPGTTKITFTLAQPWKHNEPAETKIYKITVTPLAISHVKQQKELTN